MVTNNVAVKEVKYPGELTHYGMGIHHTSQPPLMSYATLKIAASDVKKYLSVDEHKKRVRQLQDEILRYGDYTEPQLQPSILLDLWGIWVNDNVANPDADIFVSCLEALVYAENDASISYRGWNQWLQNYHNLTKVVERIFQSKYTDERYDMIGALIPIVNLDGLAILMDAIDRFNDRNDYASLFAKANVALDSLKKSHADTAKWIELKRRFNDFVDATPFHMEIERIINEGQQLSAIRARLRNTEKGAAESQTKAKAEIHNTEPGSEWKQWRLERAKDHYQFRLKNHHVAVERILSSAKSVPIEQAAAALARLRRSLSGEDPQFGEQGSQNLNQFVREHLTSAQASYAVLIRI